MHPRRPDLSGERAVRADQQNQPARLGQRHEPASLLCGVGLAVGAIDHA